MHGEIELEETAESMNSMPSKSGRVVLTALLICLGLTAIAVTAWFLWPKNRPDANKNVVTVMKGTVDLRISATGVIRPHNQVKISPKVTGLLKKLLVKQGDAVTKGQLVAQMDDSNLQGQVHAARSALALAQANYEKAVHGNRPQEIANSEAQLRKTENIVRFHERAVARAQAQVKSAEAQVIRDETNAKRLVQLAGQGAISDQDGLNASTQAQVSSVVLRQAREELKQADSSLAQSRAELESARQQFSLIKAGYREEDVRAAHFAAEQARGNLRFLESQLNDTQIKAPFDGVIAQKYTDEGAIVTPTTSAATTSATSSSIVSLAGFLELVASVSETDIEHIKPGQKVEIVANAYPDKVFTGTVNLIAPEAVVTQNVTTFEVHATIDDDPRHELMSGMNVTAQFVAGKMPDALLVPTAAIISQHGKTGVLIPDKEGAPSFKPVGVGATSGNKTILLSGLKEGDKVFLGLSKAQLEQQGYADPNNQLRLPGYGAKGRPAYPRGQGMR